MSIFFPVCSSDIPGSAGGDLCALDATHQTFLSEMAAQENQKGELYGLGRFRHVGF